MKVKIRVSGGGGLVMSNRCGKGLCGYIGKDGDGDGDGDGVIDRARCWVGGE